MTALRLAWRQARGARRHFFVFFACVVLGVAALVSVGSFGATLNRTLAREAKGLLGGDVELRAARPLPEDVEREIAALVGPGAMVVQVRELVGMARGLDNGRSLLVELKAVGREYPLYGRLATTPAEPLAALLADHGAVVQREALERLGLRVGDRLALGTLILTVRGVVDIEPDRSASLVRLGPRMFVAPEALEQSGLLQLGSRVRYRTLVKLPPAQPARGLSEALARRISDPGIRVSSFDEAQPGLRRFFTQLTSYLGLVGLASLLVGGIGVASSVSAFVRRQQPTIAILKSLGATSRTIVTMFLVQTQVVGVAGSLVGAAFGVALQPLLITALAGFVPFTLEPRADAPTVARGVIMGSLTTLLCVLWPLLDVREVRAALVLRRDVEAAAPDVHRRPWVAALPIAAGLAALALWQAGSFKIGGIFVGASVGAVLGLWAVARGLVVLARRLPRPPSPAWQHGLGALRRPGGQAARVVIALGAGVMLLVAVALLQQSLDAQIDHEQRRQAPSFFFLDVQPDQRDAFAQLVRQRTGGTAPTLTPIVRSRLAAIDGEPVTRAMVQARGGEARETAFYYTREYVLTWAAEPPAGNTITRGHWWNGEPGPPRVSVEEVMARQLGVDIGSRLTFDVQGVPLEAEVTSLRKVDWQSLTTNFFVVFSPGALDGAPTTYVAAARTPAVTEATLQSAVVSAFPNVTAIPVRDVLERVGVVLANIAVAIRVIALFTVGTGLVVMAGALASTRYQRLYESVVLRTLGATRGAVARAFAVEYGCLGAAAGVGGTALAAVLAWVVLRFVLETPWRFEPMAMLAGVVLTVALSMAVGFLTTFRLLGAKPLPVLRRE
ncbi:MAG TPA: FtsX-like permease family protein [Methylomirabilota bacterium]|nr:FtsX-like permease family protein [Methylomirabilota bacterium]